MTDSSLMQCSGNTSELAQKLLLQYKLGWILTPIFAVVLKADGVGKVFSDD